ncbi:MAG TPA: lysylphosphatidylglycerol synthase transmembrane domain-containing protein [Thermomicrobiaceae bacterium]|nr:lysylphosphatidylglycerol synthase transmembrane domain-containing protein [Thermomicrobiaceae bacterium]
MSEPTRAGAIRRAARALRRHAALIWLLAVGALVLVFVVRQRQEIVSVAATLGSAQPGWLLGSGLLELAVLGLMAWMYRLLMGRLGYRLSLLGLVSAYLQGFLVGAVIPFGGPTSVYVFVRRVMDHGVTTDDALLASGLGSLLGFASFLLVLAPALAVLAAADRLSRALVAGAGLFGLTFVLLVAAVLVVLRGPPPPGWFLAQVPARLRQFVEHAREHRLLARELVGPLAVSLAVDGVGMSMLYLSLRAVGARPSLLVPLAGYQVEMLFNVIAPLFQGFGLVEVSMTVVLAGLGVPGVTAVAATLVYRLWDLWLPLALGFGIQLRRGVPAGRRGQDVGLPAASARREDDARAASAPTSTVEAERTTGVPPT